MNFIGRLVLVNAIGIPLVLWAQPPWYACIGIALLLAVIADIWARVCKN